MSVLEENNIVLNGKHCWEKNMKIEKVRSNISQFSYTGIMMNMNSYQL